MRNESEWVSALQAVHLLALKMGNDSKAKKAIVERLRDGAIDARAVWMAMAVDVGRPYVLRPISFEIEEGEKIPAISSRQMHEQARPITSMTRYGDGLAFMVNNADIFGGMLWKGATKPDMKRWDWAEGMFLVSYAAGTWKQPEIPQAISEKYPMRMFVLGTEFKRAHIEGIVGREASQEVAVKPETRGRKLSESFPDWVAAVVALHHEGELDGITETHLIRKVATYLAAKGIDHPTDTTVRATAKAVVKILNPPM